MASLFDVTDALQAMALEATGALVGRIIDVAQGWPQPDDVDAAMKDGRTLVSIYPVPSTTSDPGQVMNWTPLVIAAPVRGLIAEETEVGFSLTGTPGVGEYVTVILNGHDAFSVAASAGDTATTMLATLATEIGPRATLLPDGLALATVGRLEVRTGAPGTAGQHLHRQRQQFRIIVWAPAPADRAAIAGAVDVALKRNLTFTLPDTSTALLTYQTLNLDDRYEVNGCYRADLIWSATWDTFDVFPGYEVTSVTVTLKPGPTTTSPAY